MNGDLKFHKTKEIALYEIDGGIFLKFDSGKIAIRLYPIIIKAQWSGHVWK